MNHPRHVYSWERRYSPSSLRRSLLRRVRWEMPWTHFKRVFQHERERVNHGYSWHDWISFDTYICLVIADACRDFALHGMGHPCELTEEEWHDVLCRIEAPLRWWAEDKFDNDLDHEAETLKYREAQAAMALFAEHLGSMWD